jgi:hypothetical protein
LIIAMWPTSRRKRASSASPETRETDPETEQPVRLSVISGGSRPAKPTAGVPNPLPHLSTKSAGQRWFRLVVRDRRLLALLSEHKVLTTNQIVAIEFASVLRAQDRLREPGAVFALGYLGTRLIAAQRGEKPAAPKWRRFRCPRPARRVG